MLLDMRGDMLDLILLAAAALFAISGYRQGFVVGVLSFVGFLGGGVLGANIAPSLATAGPLSSFPRTTVAILLVFVLATLGQVLATLVGNLVRDKIVWKPVRVVDSNSTGPFNLRASPVIPPWMSPPSPYGMAR